MKHNTKTTTILLSIFLVIQIVGIFVINQYYKSNTDFNEERLFFQNKTIYYIVSLFSTILLLLFAVALMFKYKINLIFRIWFMLITIVACTITINSVFTDKQNLIFTLVSLVIAVGLGISKVFFPNKYTNFISDILIYPGISIIFIYSLFNKNPKINILILFAILVGISIYDFWAVRKSKIMTKMAKYQIEKLNLFGGIMVPVISKKDRQKLKEIKQKYKKKEDIIKAIKRAKINASIAVLGGGDIAFSTISIGMFMYSFPTQTLFGITGLFPGLFALIGAILGIMYIFFFGDKKKPYPAMPYITIGISLMMLIWKVCFF